MVVSGEGLYSEVRAPDSVTSRAGGPDGPPTLSRNVAALGLVSLCMAMSSAMIHGLLPAFLVTVLGVSVLSVGAIEGIAEATTSFVKIFSGGLSDGLGRRKILVVLGYSLSAITKLLFPLAETASTILAARTIDRIGKGIRDAPRDALLADVAPSEIRRSGYGLRTALYTVGAVAGPLTAIGPHDAHRGQLPSGVLARGDPGFLVHRGAGDRSRRGFRLARRTGAADNNAPGRSPAVDSRLLVGALDRRYLALARCSQAFLLLKAGSVGVDPAFAPIVLVLMNLVYSLSAYPCGVLADQINRRLQLGVGVAVLIGADLALIFAQTIWLTAIGAALWVCRWA